MAAVVGVHRRRERRSVGRDRRDHEVLLSEVFRSADRNTPIHPQPLFIDNFWTATCNHREVDHRAGGVANEWPVRPGRIVASLSGDVGPSRDQIIDVAPNASGGRNGLSDSMYYIY